MEKSFIDELLAEEELKEELRTEAYYDLLLLQIKELQADIETNFKSAEKEIEVINNWALKKNLVMHERVNLIERKLEAFIREKDVKTLDLPNGTLKLHKKPDKVEISDLNTFLANAKPEMLTVIPEQIKPDMTKIRAFMKQNYTPAGVSVIEGKEEFSYKLKEVRENGREEETGARTERPEALRIAV